MSRGLGPTQRKILLLLQAGAGLALSSSPRTSFKILKAAGKEWENMERAALSRSIKKLYQSKLITAKDNTDGSTTIILNRNGTKKAITYKLDEMKIKQRNTWDGKWRIILFDIPEQHRKARDTLRYYLKRVGCHELQKSVFVHPHDCRDEIDFLIEFFHVRPFVRFAVADYIDTALHLKRRFNL